MKDTFLSIDLDYWDCHSLAKKIKNFPVNREKLFNEIFKRKISYEVYVTHDEMLEQIKNCNKIENIVNLDFHSDLTDKNKPELNEGTLFNFITDKEKKSFIWILPRHKNVSGCGGAGRCDHLYDSEYSIWNKKYFIYNQQIKTTNKNFLNLDNVKEIGICLSPDWVSYDTYSFIKERFSKNKKFKQIYEICCNQFDEDEEI